MAWPTPQEYNEAIQNPALNLPDPELSRGTPELTALGLPRPITGNFASVYRLSCPTRQWAIRCFWREYADMQERYAAIGAALAGSRLPSMVSFDYLPAGIRVAARSYPILRMEWVDGMLLNEWIRAHAHDAGALRRLARQWLDLAVSLERAGIAHCDLQHGNILVAGGALRLVDYDAMFVPGLAGRGSHEIGHQHYQHPNRGAADFGPTTDRFSVWVIYLSLVGMAVHPDLWDRTGAGDEHLLFTRDDFIDPEHSAVVAALRSSPDPELARLTARFTEALKSGAQPFPSVSAVLAPRPSRRQSPRPGSVPSTLPEWVQSQLPAQEEHARSRHQRWTPVVAGALTATVLLIPAGSMALGLALIPTLVLSLAAGGCLCTGLALLDVDARQKALLQLRIWLGQVALLLAARSQRPRPVRGRYRLAWSERALAWHRWRIERLDTKHQGEIADLEALRSTSEARRTSEIAAVTARARAARDARLGILQERAFRHSMRRARLRPGTVPGMPFGAVLRLRFRRVNCAADIDDLALRQARRIDPELPLLLLRWKVEVESRARQEAPRSVPLREEARLREAVVAGAERAARRAKRRDRHLVAAAYAIDARHGQKRKRMLLRQSGRASRTADLRARLQAMSEERSVELAGRRLRLLDLQEELASYHDVRWLDAVRAVLGHKA